MDGWYGWVRGGDEEVRGWMDDMDGLEEGMKRGK